MTIPNLTGLLLGLIIGTGFAGLQWFAQRRHEKKGDRRPLAALPGSMTRVALLLLALALAQVTFPGASLWWLTGGLLVALLLPMSWRLQRMRATVRS